MKKKILALAMALAVLASLTGCAENNKASEPVTEQTTTAPVTEQTTTAPVTEQTTPEATEPEKTDKFASLREKMSENDLCAVAYIGGCESVDDVESLVADSACAAQYPFITESADRKIVSADGGWDVYCIVPADENTTITVSGVSLDENAEIVETGVVYSGNNEVVVLYCNVSDILANALVTATSGDKSVSFRPHISLRDGSLETAESGVFDFTADLPSIAD